MKAILLIACGGALGAIFRYGASLGATSLFGKGFPYGTLFVNVAGSFLMGLLGVVLLNRFDVGSEWRLAILVGLLGSFTTFSTFSMETLNLFEDGYVVSAISNVFLNITVCMIAVWFGVILGRQL